MKRIVFLLLLAGLYPCLPTHAETYVLNLEKSIEVAKEKSLNMLSLRQDLKIAEFNLKSTTSRLRTHVNLSLESPNYSEGIQSNTDKYGVHYFYSKYLNMAGTLNISQPLPTDGSISLISNITAGNDMHLDERSMVNTYSLRLTQPLNALYGYNQISSSFKQAKLDYERSQKQLKRAELDLNYNVSNAFYRVLSVQKALEISKSNLERQQEAFNVATQKYKAGFIKEVDALQMEVDLAEAKNNYDMAIINQTSTVNAFKELIGIEYADSVVISSELVYKVVVVDPERAVAMALQNRLEIREQEIQIETNKLSIKQQRANGMVRGDIEAYYQRQGLSEADSVSFKVAFNRMKTDLFNRSQSYGVGIKITVPIIDWGENRALVNAAKARLKQSEYQQKSVNRSIEGEVRNLVADLNSSLKRLQLLEKNVKIAEKSFEITRQRFSDGDIDSQALALERDRLNNAYNSHLSAYINYQLMLSDIRRKTFYDFENDRPLM